MTPPRRVLIVSQYFWPEVGAPQVALAAVTRALIRLGVTVDVLTGVPNYPTGRIHYGYDPWRPGVETHDGVRIHRLPLFAYGGTNKWLRLLNHGSLATTAFAGAVMAFDPDLVVVESPPLPLVITAAAIARRNRAPLVIYLEDLWPDIPIAMGALRPGFVADRLRDLESLCYRLAWRITVTSEGQREALAAHPSAGAEKLLLLPNGFDGAVFHPIDRAECAGERETLGALAERALFVYAGTIGHVSALDTLLEAADTLRSDARIGIVFVGDGPERVRLERVARERGLDNVVFVGAVQPESVARYFALARASISSQRDMVVYERVRPAKVLPSLGCATPVIYAGRGEMADLLLRERCGVVVPPEDESALVTAIRGLADDEGEAREMGERGRALALREYDFQTLAPRWWKRLEVAFGSRRG